MRAASRLSLPSVGDAAGNGAGTGQGISSVLGAGYALVGRALRPLFYLNRNFWGEQMLLAARKR